MNNQFPVKPGATNLGVLAIDCYHNKVPVNSGAEFLGDYAIDCMNK
jgi:hypothetical protein